MVFSLTDEQQDFQNTLRRFFEQECSRERVRQLAFANQHFDQDLVKKFDSLGLVQVYGDSASAESALPELFLLAREAGRALCPVPLMELLCAGPYFFSTAYNSENDGSVARLFGDTAVSLIRTGKMRVVRAPVFYRTQQELNIEVDGAELYFSGTLRLVPAVTDATILLYQDSQGYYAVDLRALDSITRISESVLDLTQARERYRLNRAKGCALSVISVERCAAIDHLLISAEVIGALWRVHELTRDYLKTREQFGMPIGAFQAVQHAAADMYLKVEMLDSLHQFSVWALDNSPSQAAFAAQAAMRFALRESVGVVEKAIQLHGGIGFTWEHDLHLFLRRVRSLCALVGSMESFDAEMLAQFSV